jgi:hypothetical protein
VLTLATPLLAPDALAHVLTLTRARVLSAPVAARVRLLRNFEKCIEFGERKKE